MNVILRRSPSTQNGTFGVLAIDGKNICVTLERPKIGEHPCIPDGVYQCEKYLSPTKGDVWLLKDVPDRSMIEIHSANVYTQLLGCIAPGEYISTFDQFNGLPGVTNSKKTMTLLKSILPDNFTLEIL